MAEFSAGRIAESRAALQRLIERSPDLAPSQIATAFAWQGNAEQTFIWLDRAIAIRDPGLFGIQDRPAFDRFKADPRFQRALRLMNVIQ